MLAGVIVFSFLGSTVTEPLMVPWVNGLALVACGEFVLRHPSVGGAQPGRSERGLVRSGT